MNHPPRLRALLAATTLAVVGALLPGQPARAAQAQYNVVDRTSADVTADALPTTQIDGIAWDQVIVGGTVYAGGEFANARPAGAAPGTNQTPRSNLLAYDLATGVLKPGFAPVVNGRVKSLAVSPDGRKLYIGGNFTSVNGQPRNRVAAFNLSDGSLDATFHPSVNSDVNALAATDSTVYFGGVFSAVDGAPRSRLAAASRAGELLAWAPRADLYVNTMTLTPDASKLAVGGSFSTVNDAFSPGLAFIDTRTATLYPFAANQVVQNHGNTSGIYSLKNDGRNLLATGWWFAGVGNFEGLFSATPDTGEIRWMADCHGDTYDATTIGPTTYSVGHHHFCGNMGSFPEQNPRVFERAAAFTDRATSTTLHDSQGYHDFFGQPAPSQVNWSPDLSAANVSGSWQAAWTAESNDKYLVLGGEFPKVNNVGQQGLVRFALPGIAPGKSGPRYTWNWTPTATVVGTTAKVSWPANTDRDNMVLTYRLYRNDRPGSPLWTGTGESQWFNRPVMGFLDDDMVAGTTYSYWVTATDPDGNVATSTRVKVTAGTTTIPTTPYSAAVQADGASHYWRLLENAGSAASIDWRGGNDLQLGTGVALGQAGAVGDGSVDSAAAFDGTVAGRAATGTSEAAPEVFSTELWMRTTTTEGGELLAFGDQQTGESANHDRQLYMDTTGRLHFGVWAGTPKVVSSSGAYNDGDWHHVVSSLSPAGQQLWVDGRLVASDATSTAAQADLRGHWRVAGDNTSGWPGAEGIAPGFHGSLDEVAVYPTALTRDQVRNHYTQSGRTLALPAAPSDAYGKAVLADDPELFWRLDETRTPVVVDAGAGLDNGTWYGTPQLRTPSPVTGANGTGVTVGGEGVHVAADRQTAGPQVFGLETWFSTTSTSGGKLIGFGNARDGLSNHYDRHVWMDEQGRLSFGVYDQGTHTVTSTEAYNDGAWHHVVAGMDAKGMVLYVDGVQVGTDPHHRAEDFIGHWRLGGDSSWSGKAWFDGQLDEAAVYPRVLDADQVRAHYRASAAAVNKAPVASFTATCEGATCTFDATASSDPDGTVGSWTWDFGDGTKASGRTATRTYATGGEHTVTLTVADDQALKASTTRQVSPVLGNRPPVADIQATCTDLSCSFDSSGSSDPDGRIVRQAWDFGDGSTSTEVAPRHAYAAAGSHEVVLVVTDDAGATHRVTRTVAVSAGNVAPTASFTSTVTDLAVDFDASASRDEDGTIASASWDFGDGSTGTGLAASHRYAQAGTYSVTLTVVDDRGGRDSRTAEVVVSEPVNTPPVASFEAVVTGNDVALDATDSTDADGRIVRTSWEFGDGTTGTGATVQHRYETASTYTVTLTVTDDAGASTSTTRAVTITQRPNQAPSAAFTHTAEGLSVGFDASQSQDADGSIASYEWDFGDGQEATGRTVRHEYAQGGSHRVTLVVTDDSGATATTSRTVEVSAPAVAAVIGRDTFGAVETRWGSADLGGAYSYPANGGSFSTDGSKGLVRLPAGSSSRVLLPGATATDMTVQADLSLDRVPDGGGVYSSLMARASSAGSYMMGVRWLPGGDVHLVLYRNNGTSSTALREVAVPVTHRAGTVLRASFTVSGTRLEGRVWEVGSTEPAAAQVVATDATAALQGAGSAGLNTYVSGGTANGPLTLGVDNLTITKD